MTDGALQSNHVLLIVRKMRNREKWKRFSSCEICNSKLMAYLEKGHTFEVIMEKLHEKHPEIKNIRQYTQHAIRSATGLGLWDDYIWEHKLWPLRIPVLMKDRAHDPAGQRVLLEEIWKTRAEKGRKAIELTRKVHEALDREDEVGELILYAVETVRLKEAAP